MPVHCLAGIGCGTAPDGLLFFYDKGGDSPSPELKGGGQAGDARADNQDFSSIFHQ